MQVKHHTDSQKCKKMLKFFSDGKHHSRAEISTELDLTQSQITNAFELLKRKGYVFESFTKNKYKHYRLSENMVEPNTYMLSQKQINERLIIELNRIRLLSIQDGYWKIERIARQALESGGIYTQD
tara:strand:+ start:3851 stop:4228 length:378 start_codon:yes stop_codon:yes gene_type:complete